MRTMSQFLSLAAVAALFCGPAATQTTDPDLSNNVMKRLPGYVQLLPKKHQADKAAEPVIANPLPAVERKVRCAHILTVPVDQSIDPGIISKTPEFESRMPIYRGIPGCSEDQR